MKLTELRCLACGGALKIDENNPEMAVCEYCNTQYALERESNHIVRNRDLFYDAPVIEKKTGWEPGGWKRILAVCLMGLVIIAVIYGPKIYERWQMDKAAEASGTADTGESEHSVNLYEEYAKEVSNSEESAGALLEESSEEPEEILFTGAIGEMAEMIFGMPAEQIPQKELEKIKWIEAYSDMDYLYLGYSFENPLENEEAELTWFTFSHETELGKECLSHFTGLKKLELPQVIYAEDIQGLQLESIGGYFISLSEFATMLDDVSLLRELRIEGGLENLDGLEQFTGLQSLTIGDADVLDIDRIAGLPELKAFSIQCFEPTCDLSVLGTMDYLEEVSIDIYGQKDFGFLKQMDSLRRLEIINAGILSTDQLEGLEHLEALKLECCNELRSMETIGKLTGLKELSVELPYDCPAPDLSGLTQLEKLALSQFTDCSFVGEMVQLTSLELNRCGFGENADLSGLVNLEELTCSTFTGIGLSMEFVTEFPSLKRVELIGVSTYDDISGIFNMPGLTYLDISGMECEINFDNIADNPSLETLKMDGVLLYENVQTGGEGGFIWSDWDEVILDEHTEFLTHFPELRELSMRENELTNIEFAANLPKLEVIDISDNYIFELRPLAGASSLREVICTENPISNDRVLDDKVIVISK